jgi:hypothetical protein
MVPASRLDEVLEILHPEESAEEDLTGELEASSFIVGARVKKLLTLPISHVMIGSRKEHTS